MAIKEPIKEEQKTFTIPKGKKLVDAKVFCKKHGDITKSASFFSYQTTKPSGEIENHRSVFCIPCICEYLTELQKEGKIAEHALVPIFDDDIPEGEEKAADESAKENTEEKSEN